MPQEVDQGLRAPDAVEARLKTSQPEEVEGLREVPMRTGYPDPRPRGGGRAAEGGRREEGRRKRVPAEGHDLREEGPGVLRGPG